MTAIEAYLKFENSYSDLVVLSCYEYESCFVFHAVPSTHVESNADIENMAVDSLYAVDKQSGEVSHFNPFDIAEEEYSNGKKVNLSFGLKIKDLSVNQIEAGKTWLYGSSEPTLN